MECDFDVAIAGAGPVGLSLALGLARRGRTVILLEKDPGLSEHSRAPVIWPRTQELLADLGVLDRFVAAGITLDTVRLWDADQEKVLLQLPLHELAGETPFPRLLILPQEMNERFLYEAVREHASVDARFAAPLTGFSDGKTGVQVQYQQNEQPAQVSARFLIGCDGAHSKVRERLGFPLEGETFPLRASLADVRLAEDRDFAFPRVSQRGQLAVGIRMTQDLWRLILPFFGHGESGTHLDERIEDGVRGLFGQTGFETVWSSDFHLHNRVCRHFVRGRVALAGDAAHLNSPVGGQGMNAGFHDVAVLLKCLDEAVDQNDPTPLKTYERNRLPRIQAGVNRFTSQLTRLLFLGRGRYVKRFFALADAALRLPWLRRRILRRIAMLDS